MDTIDDGGPAFPHAVSVAPSGDVYGSDYFGGGMSLRDWFAGQALVGILASPADIIGHPATSRPAKAIVAYEYADAMLAARKTEAA